jgi:hypothetical protein
MGICNSRGWVTTHTTKDNYGTHRKVEIVVSATSIHGFTFLYVAINSSVRQHSASVKGYTRGWSIVNSSSTWQSQFILDYREGQVREAWLPIEAQSQDGNVLLYSKLL